ncbi:protein of unknown function [Paenibacillus alvei]|uniref:Uncharacterized protein n=1 Tax=Paenibacillus alvei TaxID=44250 RepID=A0A383RDB8_PAEAL|nr:protein of unknown function [Paenibacillus alvei]
MFVNHFTLSLYPFFVLWYVIIFTTLINFAYFFISPRFYLIGVILITRINQTVNNFNRK